MRKFVILAITTISIVCNILLLAINSSLKETLDTYIQSQKKSENTISVVDTIYGRKYVVEVDTITGTAVIIGLRTFNPKQ